MFHVPGRGWSVRAPLMEWSSLFHADGITSIGMETIFMSSTVAIPGRRPVSTLIPVQGSLLICSLTNQIFLTSVLMDRGGEFSWQTSLHFECAHYTALELWFCMDQRSKFVIPVHSRQCLHNSNILDDSQIVSSYHGIYFWYYIKNTSHLDIL